MMFATQFLLWFGCIVSYVPARISHKAIQPEVIESSVFEHAVCATSSISQPLWDSFHPGTKCFSLYASSTSSAVAAQLEALNLPKSVAATKADCVAHVGMISSDVRSQGDFVTFPNHESSTGPQTKKFTDLLTIPNSYHVTVKKFDSDCGGVAGIMQSKLEAYVAAGWSRFREDFYPQHPVGDTTVYFCFHTMAHASVKWVHLHTFVGQLPKEHMPTSDTSSAFCTSIADKGAFNAAQIASALLAKVRA